MATRTNNDSDPAITVAALGGGALLAWLLLRGRWGFGGGDGGRSGKGDVSASVAAVASAPPPVPAEPPCRVRISGRVVTVNGLPAELRAVVDTCRAAGSAELVVVGDAVVGVADETVRALNRAGVPLSARGDFDISRALGRP